MLEIEILSPAVQPAEIPPIDVASFGKNFAPTMFIMEYKDLEWRNPRIQPVAPLELHPAALVLHYAQEIFDGIKAYHWDSGEIGLFRPEQHAMRFNKSAQRMAMPQIPKDHFVQAHEALVKHVRSWIPKFPGSLYLRPTMIATESCIGVRASKEFLFYILALPVGAYFKEGGINVLVSDSVVRAFPGGTGNVKVGLNYGITLDSIARGKERGCDQILFLDGMTRKKVEEMGGMNIFFRKNNKLITPSPEDLTILPGFIRDSLMTIAHDMDLPVVEEDIPIQEVFDGIHDGSITEAFASGTAAVVTGIRAFHTEKGAIYNLPIDIPSSWTKKLSDRLTAIQFGRYEDTHSWVKVICHSA